MQRSRSPSFALTTLLASSALALPACADPGDDAAPAAEAPAASVAPAVTTAFPPSTMITGLAWNFASRVQLAAGSDLWPTTQLTDGSVFTGWGDGGGFQGADQTGRVSIGFARITGAPPNITGTNVWGSSPQFAQNPATFCGKPNSLIAVGSTIYGWISSTYNPKANDFFQCPANPTPGETRLAVSTDGGAHFTEPLLVTRNPGVIVPGAFINFGNGNAGARDGFVYITASKITATGGGDGNTYVIRTTPANLPTMSAWQYFTGFDATTGAPQWGAAAAAVSVFADPNFPDGAGMSYHPATNRYLLASCGATISDIAIYEGPQPWGPWATVFATHTLGPPGMPFGASEALGMSYPEAWMSGDGKTMWAAFSAGAPAGPVGDALNLMSATLTLANQGITIKAPTAYAQVKAAVGARLYTDRLYTVNTLSANLAGGELLQLANDDKASTAATQMTFTITSAQTVYVAVDPTIAPVPSWLSTWTKDTASVFKWNNQGGVVVTFDVYKKAFAGGSTVSLPGNLNGTTGGAHSNYTVIVH